MIIGDIVLNPSDGIVNTISKVLDKDYGLIKNIVDIVMIC